MACPCSILCMEGLQPGRVLNIVTMVLSMDGYQYHKAINNQERIYGRIDMEW